MDESELTPEPRINASGELAWTWRDDGFDEAFDPDACAAWLQAEAEGADADAAASYLLLAAELRASCEEIEDAKRLALEAEAHAPGAGLLLARQLAVADQDLATAYDLLRRWLDGVAARSPETTTTADGSEPRWPAETIAHHLILIAELHRLVRGTPVQGIEFMRRAHALLPADPRPGLFQFLTQYEAGLPLSISWPNSPGGERLNAFATELVQLVTGPGPTQPSSALTALSWARACVQKGDLAGTIRYLPALLEEEELGTAASWLLGCALIQKSEQLADALPYLDHALASEPDPSAERSVALLRFLSLRLQGQLDAAGAVLGGPAFTQEDRLAVNLLTGMLPQAPAEYEPTASGASRALAFAAATLARRASALTSDSGGTNETLELWLALGRGERELPPPRHLSTAADGLRPLAEFIGLEHAAEHNAPDVGQRLANFFSIDAPSTAAASFVGAVLTECHRANTQDDVLSERMTTLYASAVASENFTEPSLWGLGQAGPRDEALAQKALTSLAPGQQRDYLSFLLGLSDGTPPTTPAEGNTLSAMLLGLQRRWQLRRSGRCTEWLECVQASGKAPSGATEGLLPALLQALDGELSRPQRAAAFTAAQDTLPADLSLSLALWQLSPPSTSGAAAQLERLGRNTQDPALKAALLLAAAWHQELSFETQKAAELAQECLELDPNPIAKSTFERTAVGTELEPQLVAELSQRVFSDAPEAERSQIALELASIAHRRGERNQEGTWLRHALRLSPRAWDALLRAEHFGFETGDRELLLEVEQSLAATLDEPERTAHLELAARLQRQNQDYPAAIELLKQIAIDHASSSALRHLQAQLRLGGDEALLIEVCRELRRRAERPYDRSRLAYEAAQVAARQEQPALAVELLQEAIGEAPDNWLAHDLRAQLLEARTDVAAAALAYEQSAHYAASNEHGALAFLRAGKLWLEVGEQALARAAFEAGFERDPANEALFDALSEHLDATLEAEARLDLVSRALAATSDAPRIQALRREHAELMLTLGRAEEAAPELRRLAEEHNDGRARLLLGRLLATTDPEQAEAVLLELPRRGDTLEVEAAAYRILAQLYAGPLASPRRAERCHREILRRIPDDPEARAALAEPNA